MKVKICGIREQDNATAIAVLQPEWMGFIFAAESPRCYLRSKQPADLRTIPSSIKKVGVFVNENLHKIAAIQAFYGLDALQLHGNETPEECDELQGLGVDIIKAFSVNDRFDFLRVTAYEPYVDILLFDTAGAQRGGNGVQFNWELLNKERFDKPFLLSGGIGPNDAAMVKSFYHPDMLGIDVNSKFETAPGVKDVQQLQSFMQQL